LGIVGTGTIAYGLVRAAESRVGVRILARSTASGRRLAERVPAGDVEIGTDVEVLEKADVVVEAAVEHLGAKAEIYDRLNAALAKDVVLATTTSSLSIAELADLSGRPARFAGLHVFNPVHRMPLAELVPHRDCHPETLQRLDELCAALGKTAVVVPDSPGFVVNALLFPYLFQAVEMIDRNGLAPEDVDTCMRLGAGHPMGPLELLDMVGLDVALAIGHNLGLQVPRRLVELVGAGRLGRKSGAGFLQHSNAAAAATAA
jgi:3-hydroxyacyl-CoA dehydrogenase